MRITTSISIEADKRYVKALGLLALRKETTIAALVRAAMDQVYGEQIDHYTSFFNEDGSWKQQTELPDDEEDRMRRLLTA